MAESHELLFALREGRTEDARSIINSADFDPNARIIKETYYGENEFPLVLAAQFGNNEIVELLIEKGADLATQGTNALIGAIDEGNDYGHFRGHVETVRLLLAYPEIDINAQEEKLLESPLHRAIRRRANIEIIKLLLAYGADVNTENKFGNTPLTDILFGKPHNRPEYTNQVLDLLLENTTLEINKASRLGNALQILEHEYATCSILRPCAPENFYANIIMKLIVHGAIHPDPRMHQRMLRGFPCICGRTANNSSCPCKTMGVSRFIQNRRNATWKRRRAALTGWHAALENENNESTAVHTINVGNNGNKSVKAALQAFRNLGYHVGSSNKRKTMRRRRSRN